MKSGQRPPVGRGATVDPPNRFERLSLEIDFEQLESEETSLRLPTQFLPDESKSILRKNLSPDIPFTYSINPYRGCEHGCAYCYARPGHETLGMNAGLDFETKILVKYQAAALLQAELARSGWRSDVITISGVTDCYQPVERRLRITRQCLEVMRDWRQSVAIVTKNALVVRDLDILSTMAARRLTHVLLSITSLDQSLTRVLEPRTSSPQARLRAARELSDRGVPVSVMVAPVIPGINDHEIPSILEAAKEMGAQSAAMQMLRLPLSVAPVFLRWLEAHFPERRARVESLIRDMRHGRLNNSQFGERMRGVGSYAEGIRQTFDILKRKLGLDRRSMQLDVTQFRHPQAGRQLELFS